MTINWKYTLVTLCIALVSVASRAETLQSLESIEQAAYVYALGQSQANFDNAQIVMESLDSRLRLQACEGQLEPFSNSTVLSAGNQTIGVRCFTPVAWTVYVPVRVKVLRSVVVAARPLAANQIIKNSDVKLEQLDISSLHRGYIKSTKHIVGQQLKYPISMGTVINPNSVRPEKIVHRGEQIMLVAMAGQMEVRMSGIALSDASFGQRIRVKNASSKRVVEGVVDGPGVVKVTM